MDIKIGTKYKHFKGGEYEIIALAKDSETQEEVMVYKALYGEGQTWTRPLKMFAEEVNRPEIPYNGPRFVRID